MEKEIKGGEIMWFDILKKANRWHKYIDDIMSDKTTRTATVLHGILFDFMHSDDNDGRKRTGRGMPAVMEIAMYLAQNYQYVKVSKGKWRMAKDVV